MKTPLTQKCLQTDTFVGTMIVMGIMEKLVVAFVLMKVKSAIASPVRIWLDENISIDISLEITSVLVCKLLGKVTGSSFNKTK